jgi:hypothetical protein
MVQDLIRLYPSYTPDTVLRAPATIMQASGWGLALDEEVSDHA